MTVITEYYNNQSQVQLNEKWWEADIDSAFQSLFSIVKYIEKNQSYRNTLNLRYAKLYQNVEMLGLSAGTYARVNLTNFNHNRVSYNVVKSCTDTAASKIAKNKPKPLFLTKDGDYNLKNKAKLLTQYVEGMFDNMDIYRVAQKVFIDACVFGTGALKFYIDPASLEIKAERVFIDEIIVDDVEGMYSSPRQLHQRKYYSRDVLLGMFPKHKEHIMNATASLSGETATQSTADNVVVIESWHLPSSKEAKDGRHIIAIDNCTLVLEDYEKDHFPFVFFRWTDKLVGFWGMGLAEELIGIQLEINKVLRVIQQAQQLMAVPRIFVDVASNINTGHINNDIGSIIKYQGQPPVFQTGQANSPEVYQYLETLYNKAFEITGISRLSAASTKPPGLNSGVALREYQDIETERFMLVGQRYEELFMQAAKHIIELSKELYEVFPKFHVVVKTNKFVKKIKWEDVNMKEDEFVMDVYPVNMLPSTPAGKLQTIQELIQAGLIPQDQALTLLDFPDLEHFMSLRTAAQDNIEKMLGIMIEEGRYIAPEPFMNLELALELAQETYLRSKCDNLDESKLDLLRTFMDDINTLLGANQPLPPPEAVGGPVAPGPTPGTAELGVAQGAPLPPPGPIGIA